MFFETFFSLTYSQTTGDITGQSLYNGNISNTTLAIGVPSPPGSFANNAVGYTYHYDQLNRLKKLRQYTGIAGTGTWDRTYITLNDQENITYDGNGNILTYGRNGGDTTAQTIDSLTYNYNYTGGKLLNNQLQYIHDAVTSSGYNLDLRNQTNVNNYQYDGIGNITGDAQSGITNIGWTVYNKPDTIYKAAGNISYNYNTANQRISKTYNGLTTWYVRDAQGNVMGIYDNADSTLNWREQHLYGSSRLGIWTPNIDITDSTGSQKWQWNGYRRFELNNHLGNVLTTINDVRNPYFEPSHIGPLPGPLQYFTANVLSSQDYFAFGMLMPDRQYTLNGDSTYRYGFNGKENDNDVKGLGNQQDYGERILDNRLGRFLSVDPLTKDYPQLTPYQFSSNNPIKFIDLDGEEAYDPQAPQPTGIKPITKSTIPGGLINDHGIKLGAYTLMGVSNPDGKGYWIARFNMPNGMYRDDYIVGTDAVGSFINNKLLLETALTLGGDPQKDLLETVEDQLKNPFNWIAGAFGLVGAVDSYGFEAPVIDNTVSQDVNPQRPSSYQSEKELVPQEANPQVAFKNGKQVSSRTVGSVRPDGYNDVNSTSYEIKNYNITTKQGRSNLISNVVRQVRQRLSNLPRGSKQIVIIDTRGQNVSQGTLNSVRNRITTQAGSQNVDVQFKTN